MLGYLGVCHDLLMKVNTVYFLWLSFCFSHWSLCQRMDQLPIGLLLSPSLEEVPPLSTSVHSVLFNWGFLLDPIMSYHSWLPEFGRCWLIFFPGEREVCKKKNVILFYWAKFYRIFWWAMVEINNFLDHILWFEPKLLDANFIDCGEVSR